VLGWDPTFRGKVFGRKMVDFWVKMTHFWSKNGGFLVIFGVK
jgi:hypothetical protein